MVSWQRNGDPETSGERVLTPFQEEFIKAFSETPLRDDFFFTGGTALSAFYLEHRLSEDLDFFTEEEGVIPRVLPVLQSLSSKLQAVLEVRRNFRSYLEIFMTRGDEFFRCDFALDSPFRLSEKIFKEALGIYIDNILDISCNKLSALFDRGDPKDFVDIYFIDKEAMPFERVVEEAKKKHIGLDNYWLAVSMAKVDGIVALPKLLKPVSLEELKKFFKEKAKWLMNRRSRLRREK